MLSSVLGNCLFIFLLGYASTATAGNKYDVHWLDGNSSITRNLPRKSYDPLDIYCYAGQNKKMIYIWATIKFHLDIAQDDFVQYLGGSAEEVYTRYEAHTTLWTFDLFNTQKSHTLSLDPFNTTCMALSTNQAYRLSLQVIRIDIQKILLTLAGLILFFTSNTLSNNSVFFYLCGIIVGICASFMLFVYYSSKLFPQRPLMYGMMIGGWTAGLYLINMIRLHLQSIMISYQAYLFWYTFIAGFISFVICYRIGPLQNRRSKNLVKWTLQLMGLLVVFFSSEYKEASMAICIVSIVIKNFPLTLINMLKRYWSRRFPPKRRLMTNEEYFEEGARETRDELQKLREYCSSPDCAAWKIMLKLNDSKRFAKFVEGDSHLGDDELVDYESYAYSLNSRHRAKRLNHMNDSNTNVDISSDSSEDD